MDGFFFLDIVLSIHDSLFHHITLRSPQMTGRWDQQRTLWLWWRENKVTHRQHLVELLSQQVFLLPWLVMIFFSMWEKEILQLSVTERQNNLMSAYRCTNTPTVVVCKMNGMWLKAATYCCPQTTDRDTFHYLWPPRWGFVLWASLVQSKWVNFWFLGESSFPASYPHLGRYGQRAASPERDEPPYRNKDKCYATAYWYHRCLHVSTQHPYKYS